MDREYADALGEDPEGQFAQSLTVETTVSRRTTTGTSPSTRGSSRWRPTPGRRRRVAAGAGDYPFFGDEHGLVSRTRRSHCAGRPRGPRAPAL